MATDLAEFVGAAVGLNLLFGVPLFPAGLITAVVAFAILALEQRGYRRFELAIAGAARHRVPRLRATTWRGRRRPGRHRGRAGPAASRRRQRAARRRHHRRDGHAARGLPALGADEVPGRLPRRRRAPGAAALPAPRRGGRARRRRPDQPVDAGGRRVAVPPHRRATGVDSIEAAHAGLGRLVGGGAALAFAVALLASGPRRPRASAPTPGRSSCRASSAGGSRCSLRRGDDDAAGAGRARRSGCRPRTAW